MANFLGTLNDTATSVIDKLESQFKAQTDLAAASAPANIKQPMENIYPTLTGALKDGTSGTVSKPLTNWYQALPYGFKFTPRVGSPITMFLPISPQNLTITTHYATNVITTMYGTVEEHSEQRYFDIVIDGNTGIAPTYTDITAVESSAASRGEFNGRKSFSASETIPSNALGGFLSQQISIANQALNKAANLLSPQKNISGIHPAKTGYVAFHNLYKFFLYYKKDVAGELGTQARKPGQHPLVFFNYKDNNKYYCSITRFILKRSVDNPMVYNYTIQLRAYKIQGLTAVEQGEASFDRRKNLGLDGVETSSIFGDIRNISNTAKGVFGAISGGLKIFGS